MPQPFLALFTLVLAAVQPEDVVAAPLEQAVQQAAPTAESAQQIASALEDAEAEALSLADNADALALLDRARLALVSIYLATGAEAQAEQEMDEVIRSAMGRDIAAGSFGPVVLELYDQRLQALEAAGTATIAIDCEACQIIINETRVGEPEAPLYLGRYRVWVVFSDPARSPERLDITLETAGIVTRRAIAASNVQALGTQKPDTRGRGPRLLPRWAELLGASAGAVLIVGGSMLASIHDKCRKNASYNAMGVCDQLYENRPQDILMLGLGGSLMVAAGVVLTIDEVRIGRLRDRRAMLTWTLQF